MAPEIQKALPAVMRDNAPRFARVLLTELNKNPALARCAALSLIGGLIQSAQLGLEIGGPLGQAYLIPYGPNAQLQIGYRGLLQLAHRSGQVKTLFAHCVHEADAFTIELGTEPRLMHVPAMTNRGNMIGVYAVMETVAGGKDFEYMSLAEVEEHKKRYSKQKRNDTPWETAFEEMAKKTVIRRLAKRAPVSVEFTRAAVLDEYGEVDRQNLQAFAAAELDLDLPPERSEQAEAIEGKLPTTEAK